MREDNLMPTRVAADTVFDEEDVIAAVRRKAMTKDSEIAFWQPIGDASEWMRSHLTRHKISDCGRESSPREAVRDGP